MEYRPPHGLDSVTRLRSHDDTEAELILQKCTACSRRNLRPWRADDITTPNGHLVVVKRTVHSHRPRDIILHTGRVQALDKQDSFPRISCAHDRERPCARNSRNDGRKICDNLQHFSNMRSLLLRYELRQRGDEGWVDWTATLDQYGWENQLKIAIYHDLCQVWK